MPVPELFIVVVLVCALGALHVYQWAESRPAHAGELSPRQALRDLDPTGRALLFSVLAALAFASMAPFLPIVGGLVGAVVPG